jgi:hypothetical protein
MEPGLEPPSYRLGLSSLEATVASLSSIACAKHPSRLRLHVGPLRRPALVAFCAFTFVDRGALQYPSRVR